MTEPQLFERLRELDQIEKVSYAEKGQICLIAKNGLMHHNKVSPETGNPCSLSEWIRLAAPWSYATCFAAMRDIESLSDMSQEDLSRIPKANIQTLTQLSTAVRKDPKVIEGAKTQRPDRFIDQVQRDHPGQHISKPETLRFVVDQSEKTIVDEVIKWEMEHGAMSKSHALVSICMSRWVTIQSEELANEGK